MILPHLKPVKFVQEVVEENESFKLVSCKFPYIPTIGMICEAAAQSSSAFANLNKDEKKIGFLVSLKNIQILFDLEDQDFNIKIEKSLNFGIMTEFKFELINTNKVFAKGTFIIALPDEDTK